jgi:chemosensory pili system protein ChpC
MSAQKTASAERPVDELYSLLVPLNEGRLIVPRVCVTEVVRYSAPEVKFQGPAWFRGSISWNQMVIPTICFEDLCGLTSTRPGGRTRVAIFNALSGQLENGHFGLLTEGFPQLVRVNRAVIEVDDEHAWPDDGPVICQIRMINEHPLIPDLEKLETMIHDCLSADG